MTMKLTEELRLLAVLAGQATAPMGTVENWCRIRPGHIFHQQMQRLVLGTHTFLGRGIALTSTHEI